MPHNTVIEIFYARTGNRVREIMLIHCDKTKNHATY